MYVYYLKGLAENINVNDANKKILFEFLPLIMNDTNSIETVLQDYALNEIFFNKPSNELIERLNSSLNIQWALNIAAKFEKEFERASNNVQEWINEIEDENDREDVLSWAEKVAQGKMTEEKFLERINKL
jgi:exonuclease I